MATEREEEVLTTPTPNPSEVSAEVQALLDILPLWMQEEATAALDQGLEELVLDQNRPLMLRFGSGYRKTERVATDKDLSYIKNRLAPFRSDNRTGIDGTLHRISATKNRYGDTTGLHIRLGSFLSHIADPLLPLLGKIERGLLIIGPPKVGKTTLLRDIVRILSSELKMDPKAGSHLANGIINRYGPSVVVVDNSNEIGGDGNDTHPGIGDVTRLQVKDPSELANVLLEAIINKSPEFVIGDEIGSRADVEQVQTIAKRGAKMVATVHGRTLMDVMNNPILLPIVGNPDMEARERRSPSVFDVVFEVRGRGAIYTYTDGDAAIDAALAGRKPEGKWVYLPGHPKYQEMNHDF